MFKKLKKALSVLSRWKYLRVLPLGVIAAAEHERVLRSLPLKTVIDVGANRGQFAIVARCVHPDARLISFEPLSEPGLIFCRVFAKDDNVSFHAVAAGSEIREAEMHVSCHDDSSSLLPITALQDTLYPGTKQKETRKVRADTLDHVLNTQKLTAPILLKLDIQGYELEALKGGENLLEQIQYVYSECSFMELYQGQALASQVISFLSSKGFVLAGIYNPDYDSFGRAVQADLLFKKDKMHPSEGRPL